MRTNILADAPEIEAQQLRRAYQTHVNAVSCLRTMQAAFETAAESEHTTHADHAAHAERLGDLAELVADIGEQAGERFVDHPTYEDDSHRLPQVRVVSFAAASSETELAIEKHTDQGTAWVAALTGPSETYGVEREFITPKGERRSTARVLDGQVVELAHKNGQDKATGYRRVENGELIELTRSAAFAEVRNETDQENTA